MNWDRIARFYDWQLPLERRPIAAAVELAAPRAEERLLDVGTGTGAVLLALARNAFRPREAVGLDGSPAMLARVPTLPPGWRLRHGDVRSLPFPAGHFDIVTAAFLLHLLDRGSLGRAVSEIRRVLKPTGRLVTVTPTAPRSLLRRPYKWMVAALVPLSATSAGLRPLDPRAELARTGFVPARARYVRAGYPSLCVLARPAAAQDAGSIPGPAGAQARDSSRPRRAA